MTLLLLSTRPDFPLADFHKFVEPPMYDPMFVTTRSTGLPIKLVFDSMLLFTLVLNSITFS
jgi:hypothetical protein